MGVKRGKNTFFLQEHTVLGIIPGASVPKSSLGQRGVSGRVQRGLSVGILEGPMEKVAGGLADEAQQGLTDGLQRGPGDEGVCTMPGQWSCTLYNRVYRGLGDEVGKRGG